MQFRYFNLDRLIHSVKTALATLIGFFLAKLIGFPSDQWIVITILVVMCAQLHVGSVIHRSYMRFLGTLIGCILALITLLSFGNPTPHYALAATIAFSGFLFSYIVTGQESLSYAGTLGAVTTAIVLMSPNPTIATTGARFAEISIGLLIAAGVSQFILPIHARTYLRRSQATTLQELRNYYQALIIASDEEVESTHHQELDEGIVKLLIKQRTLAKEAGREKLGKPFDPLHFVQSLTAEKEILRSITFMHFALVKNKILKEKLKTLPTFQAFNENILKTFSVLIKAIESRDAPKEQIQIPETQMLKKPLLEDKELLSADTIIDRDGFLFAAEHLTGSLKELAKLYRL